MSDTLYATSHEYTFVKRIIRGCILGFHSTCGLMGVYDQTEHTTSNTFMLKARDIRRTPHANSSFSPNYQIFHNDIHTRLKHLRMLDIYIPEEERTCEILQWIIL